MNEKVWAGGYTIFDLGATYKTHFGKTPAELSLMCNNVFDKDYWMVSVAIRSISPSRAPLPSQQNSTSNTYV